MRSHLVFSLWIAVAAAACSRPPSDQHSYPVHGQVQSIDTPRKLVVLKHDEIKGFMPAMTMPYEVADPNVLTTLTPGDVVDSTLVVFANGAHLTDFKKVGTAPLDAPPPEAPAPSASSGFELIKPGAPVPDAAFVDQDGKKRTFSSFKGAPVVMTFIYTKCPLPTFCPLMDRHFATLQTSLRSNAALGRVRLVTVSFDPVTDTPAVL